MIVHEDVVQKLGEQHAERGIDIVVALIDRSVVTRGVGRIGRVAVRQPSEARVPVPGRARLEGHQDRRGGGPRATPGAHNASVGPGNPPIASGSPAAPHLIPPAPSRRLPSLTAMTVVRRDGVGGHPNRCRAARYLCGSVCQGPLGAGLRAAGVGQGGAPGAKRGRTTLTNPRAGADWVWAGGRRRGGALRYLGARRT